MNLRILIVIGLFFSSAIVKAQAPLTADELFTSARNAAFEEKNESKAKQLAFEAIRKSPKNADIEIFVGRLFAWNKQYDTALYHFQQALTFSPNNEDAFIAYTDLETWNQHYNKALLICNSGITSNPASEALLLRKAKILTELKQFKEASEIAGAILKSTKSNTGALALASSLKDAMTANKVGVNFGYSHFDNSSIQPWHLLSVSYSRYTKIGTLSGNINYANRYQNIGWQGEVEAYPRINKTFYSYVGFGYSSGESVFPNYRAGYSLYANLPRNWEAEAGIRYLHFTNSTYVYTLNLGKYLGNFLLSARTYVTPGNAGVSQSYNLLCRYYFKGAEDYVGITLGSGLSPDDRILSVQYGNKNRIASRLATVSFNHSIAGLNIISLKAGLLNQQSRTEDKVNQADVSLGFQRRF